jgi:DNA-binding transcriptional LysR family regulator
MSIGNQRLYNIEIKYSEPGLCQSRKAVVMRTESLACFLAVLDADCSFRRAAESLYISHQGLSKVIRSLETELRHPLFERRGKKIAITKAGRLIEPYAREITRLRSEIDEGLLGLYKAEARVLLANLSIIIAPFALRTLLFMKHDLNDFGLLDVRFKETSFNKALNYIQQSNKSELSVVDILSDDIPLFQTKYPNMVYEKVMTIPLTALGSRELLANCTAGVTLEMLKQIPIADYDTPIKRKLLDRLLGSSQDNILAQVTSTALIDDLLQQGKAITLSDTIADRFETRRLNLMSVALSCVEPATLGFMYSADKDLSEGQKAYIGYFKDLVAERYGKYTANKSVASQT